MSFWRALVPALLLSAASCADSPIPTDDTPQTSLLDQEIGATPLCPVGEQAVFWIEPTGACGTCISDDVAGEPGKQYAACLSDVQHTKKLIGPVCTAPC
jgi:hypothetical protein